MATSEDAAKQMQQKIEDVDLGGDVTILVGPEEGQARIKVSKALLSLVSKYFATLFGNTFKEGDIAAAGKEVLLKDDGAKAFVMLCKILHMRFPLPGQPLTAREVLDLAIVADKYGCVQALSLSLRSLFPDKATSGGTTFQDMGKFMCAAYLLDHAHLFQKFTRAIMADYTEPFTELALTDMGKHLPMTIWLTLESTRASVRDIVIGLLNQGMAFGCPSAASCERAKSYMATHIRNATLIGLAPLRPHFASTSTLIFKTIKLTVAAYEYEELPCNRDCPTQGQIPMTHFVDVAKTMEVECKGLCLDCVKAEGRETGTCRITHG